MPPPREQQIGTRVLNYLREVAESGGGKVILSDLEQMFPEALRSRLQGVMNTKSGIYDTEVIVRGSVWYVPARQKIGETSETPVVVEDKVSPIPESCRRVFSYVGEAREGAAVLRDENGKLWKASPL